MINIKHLAAATLVAASFGASATTFDLSSASPSGTLTGSSATDTYTFDLLSSGTLGITLTGSTTGGAGYYISTATLTNSAGNIASPINALVNTQYAPGYSISVWSDSSSKVLSAGDYTLTVKGTPTLGGSFGGNFSLSPSAITPPKITVGAVPEPESYAMLLAGLCLTGTIAAKRSKSKQS